jgi:hypothetical protein
MVWGIDVCASAEQVPDICFFGRDVDNRFTVIHVDGRAVPWSRPMMEERWIPTTVSNADDP